MTAVILCCFQSFRGLDMSGIFIHIIDNVFYSTFTKLVHSCHVFTFLFFFQRFYSYVVHR